MVAPPQFQTSASELLIEQSCAWITSWAGGYGLTYSEMMEGARDFVETGRYFSRGGLFEGEHVPDHFWHHYQVVTARTLPEAVQRSFFSCSC